MLLSFFKRKSNPPQNPVVVDNVAQNKDEPISRTELASVKSSPSSTSNSKKLKTSLPCWKDSKTWVVSETNPGVTCQQLKELIYDELRSIKDPERPATLEELNVLTEDSVKVKPLEDGEGYYIRIEFNPTIPHCSLASLIGLCLRTQVQRHVLERFKLDIVVAEGSHATEEEVNKQINDKERVTAALENPNLYEMVESCLKEEQ